MPKKVITLCASASFYREVIEIENRLKKLGFDVKLPRTAERMRDSGDFNVEHYKTWFKNKDDYYKKTELMDEHFKKIVESDAILVVNKEKKGILGYIGGSVLMEMTLAYYLKKKIFVLNEVNEKLDIEEEIRALNPIFLQGDLSKLNV